MGYRHFFKVKFRKMIQAELSRRVRKRTGAPVNVVVKPWYSKLWTSLTQKFSSSSAQSLPREETTPTPRLRTEMIRRMDDAPKLVNPSGWISEGQPGNGDEKLPAFKPPTPDPHQSGVSSTSGQPSISDEVDSVIEDFTPDSQRSNPFDQLQDKGYVLYRMFFAFQANGGHVPVVRADFQIQVFRITHMTNVCIITRLHSSALFQSFT